MSERYEIKTMADIADLTPEQFERMLPDFSLWFHLTKKLKQKMDAEPRSFLWVDDGRPGEVHSIELFVKDEEKPFQTIIGSAHPDAS